MYFVYAILSEKEKIYTGQTDNIEKRLERHNGFLKTKPTAYTKKNGKNWKLVYSEEYATRKEALKREKQLKGFQGKEFIRRIVNNMGA